MRRGVRRGCVRLRGKATLLIESIYFNYNKFRYKFYLSIKPVGFLKQFRKERCCGSVLLLFYLDLYERVFHLLL